MPQVSVKCANPDQILMEVKVSLTLPQWRYILGMKLGDIKYYGPLDDILDAVRRGLAAIESREDVTWETKPLV